MSEEKLPLYSNYIIYDVTTALYSEQKYPEKFEGQTNDLNELKKELKGTLKEWKSRQKISSKEVLNKYKEMNYE